MEVNELIDRYIHEVGRHLPQNNRTDIQMELRSLLQDSLDEQEAATGVKPTTKMAAAVLQDLGRPEEIAARYRPTQYLIGPQLFSHYQQVVVIVLAVMAGLHLLGLLFVLLQGSTVDLSELLLNTAVSLGRAAVFYAGLVTLIFAVIERVQGEDKIELREPAAWDPYDLPPVHDPDRISRWKMVGEICAILFFIILFNFFSEWIGFINLSGDSERIVAILAPEFQRHIPWLTTSWILEVLLKLVVVAQGRWRGLTRWGELLTGLFSIYVLYRVFTGGPITNIPGVDMVAHLILGLIILIEAFESIARLYRLLWKRPFVTDKMFKSHIAKA